MNSALFVNRTDDFLFEMVEAGFTSSDGDLLFVEKEFIGSANRALGRVLIHDLFKDPYVVGI